MYIKEIPDQNQKQNSLIEKIKNAKKHTKTNVGKSKHIKTTKYMYSQHATEQQTFTEHIIHLYFLYIFFVFFAKIHINKIQIIHMCSYTSHHHQCFSKRKK